MNRTIPKMTLSVDELAEELGVSRPNAYALCHRKDFPSLRQGRRILVNRAKLQAWLDEQSEGQIEPPPC